LTLSGKNSSDADHYQEKDGRNALQELAKLNQGDNP